MNRPIRAVLVANRGEIARRIFRTCRELGIATVAVHSDADAETPFVAEADRAVRLPGDTPAHTYLRGDLIIDAARRAGADAVHPGYGFLSENAEFARSVIAAGLTWIGPAPDTIEQMGSKIRAKELMAAAGVPILQVDPDNAASEDFPLLVKASAGGGGRGMRVVTDPAELESQLAAAGTEAHSAFGDRTVFVEPYLPGARHVEVQVLADQHGAIWILGDRDCSVQRRHQKVVEEAPAPDLADTMRTSLHEAARAAAAAVAYVGAGTVEFLVDGDRLFFLEMNTRLQVEHPVTEQVFGIDLVAAQISVAEGERLAEPPAGPVGHSIEVRLYAEDPADNWAPQTGTIRAFEIAQSPVIRLDSAVETGTTVGIHYDAMIAKIISTGRDRPGAIRALRTAVAGARIHGVRTNTDLLLAILDDEQFAAGQFSTRLLDDQLATLTAPSPDQRALNKAALAAALADAETACANRAVLQPIPAAFRNVTSQPRTRRYLHHGADVEVSYSGGRPLPVPSAKPELDGVHVSAATPANVVLVDNGVAAQYAVAVSDTAVDVDGPDGSFSFETVPTFVDPADAVAEGSLLAPMPASVVSVNVAVGDAVTAGQAVLVLEAMKMQHTITSPVDGVVGEISVSDGMQVESGAVVAVIESSQAIDEETP